MSTLKVNNLEDLGADPVVTNGVLVKAALPSGSIIDVKSVTKTNVFSASVAGGASVDVTSLSITHSIAKAGNKVFLVAQIGKAGSDNQLLQPAVFFAEDGTGLNLGDAEGTRLRVNAGLTEGNITNQGAVGFGYHISFLHSPAAGSKTYTVRLANPSGVTRTLYANRSLSDVDGLTTTRASSTFTLMEVAG
jgi:hypothetical protein